MIRSSRVGPGSACARVLTLPTQGRRRSTRQLQQRARQLGMSVDALHPHFELARLRMMLFLAFTFIFVFSMCVL